MNRRKTALMKVALSALHYSGAGGLLSPMTRGVGVIFTLHRVVPGQTAGFSPNRILELQPEFLDQTIQLVLDRGFDVVSLDEVHARLGEGDFDRPFACFTFDDGYRDNREHASPIFRRYGLPMAIYVPTDFPDGKGDMWWLRLEKVLAELDAIDVKIDGNWCHFDLETTDRKNAAFERIYWWLRRLPVEEHAREFVSELAQAHGVEVGGICRDLIMDWDEIRDLAADPLVTIGAHTRRHLALAKLTQSEAALEIQESVHRLEAELRRPVSHFSFPYGDASSAGEREFNLARELGLKTAVTTRKGLLHERHSGALTGLPRVSLNGDFQAARYVKVMLSGAPFALMSMAGRMPIGRREAA
ncbi:MAG: polysaccharide deacetylase family protein [Hyphomicrobiaceae bacterium]|nr:polysaccharide deacetylase family protein [Hyphomicrobiaceae bacterium]